MTGERYLVTGALGCIGAWTVKRLLDAGQTVWTYDLGGSRHRLELLLDDAALGKINYITGDVTDFAAVEQAIVGNSITHVIHLAALQIPFVRANPVLGAQVNLIGMANVLEAIKRHQEQIKGFSYASSFAVYGPPGAPTYQTASLYGVHKQAKEGMARVYWQDYGLSSIGLRPHTVYGPGRDQGMTSLPTKAMLAAAVGRSYHIGFGGNVLYHSANEVAGIFIKAATAGYQGAAAFDLGGINANMDAVVAAIEAAAPDVKGRITYDDKPLNVSAVADTAQIESILAIKTWTPLDEGIQATVEHFRRAAQAGKIDVDKSLS